MKYVRTYARRGAKHGGWRIKWFLFALLAALVITSVFLYRANKGKDRSPKEETPLEQISEIRTIQTPLVQEEKPLFEQIDMGSADGTAQAVARRGVEDGVFTHVIVATLPPIDQSTHFYEAWLVDPETIEFFSTGDFFARADGKWGLLYEIPQSEAPRDILDFSQVIITREVRDGNVAPSPTHIMEGQF